MEYSLRCEAEICVTLNNGPKVSRKIWLSSQCCEITDELKSGSTSWRAKTEGLIKQATFLSLGRKPEVHISHVRTYLTLLKSSCEDKLNRKTADFRLPSVAQEDRVLKVPIVVEGGYRSSCLLTLRV